MRNATFLYIFFLTLGFAKAEMSPEQPEVSKPPVATEIFDDEETVYKKTVDLIQYRKQPSVTGEIVSVGDGVTTMLVSRWANAFEKIYPEVKFDIRRGGTENGLALLLEGRADIVPAARPLTESEIDQFKGKFGYEPQQVVVNHGAVGIYVNKNNPLDHLTLQELDAIFSNDIRRGGKIVETWRDLGIEGPLAKRLVSRFSMSSVFGTYSYFRDVVMQGSDYRFDVKFRRVPSSPVQAVGADDAGITFASIMFATERTRFVPIVAEDGKAYLPTDEDTRSGRYPLARKLILVVNKKPGQSLSSPVLEFLRFATSRRGQRIMALSHSYPLTREFQKKSRSQFE